MTLTQAIRGLCARAYSDRTQARHPFVNIGAVIRHTKSGVPSLVTPAVENLISRLRFGQVAPKVAVDLLTHPNELVSRAALGRVVEKGLEVPELYRETFIRVLSSLSRHEIPAKMEAAGFPQAILVQLASNGGPIMSPMAMEGVAKRIEAKTIEPRLLRSFDVASLEQLLRYPHLTDEGRVSILSGALDVRHKTNIGVKIYGSGDASSYGPDPDPQHTYTLCDHDKASALLKIAFGMYHGDDQKAAFRFKLQSSAKLGRLVSYNPQRVGWDRWQFSSEEIKEGRDPIYFAGPYGNHEEHKEEII